MFSRIGLAIVALVACSITQASAYTCSGVDWDIEFGTFSGYCPCLECQCFVYPPSQYLHSYNGYFPECAGTVECPWPCEDSDFQAEPTITCDPTKCGDCGCVMPFGLPVICNVCVIE